MRKKFKGLITSFMAAGLIFCFFCFPAPAQEQADLKTAIDKSKAAGVPDETVTRMLALGYKHNLQAKEMTAFFNTINQAAKDNLPTGPLVNKIEEGMAKRVRVEAIQRVLNQQINHLRFTRQELTKTLNRWGETKNTVRHGTLTRLAQTLSTGISKQEMANFLGKAPKAPLSEITKAMEFKAALKQSGLPGKIADDIISTGLKNNYFSHPDWGLVRVISAAKKKGVSDKELGAISIKVVKGSQTAQEAGRKLGLAVQNLEYGSTAHDSGMKTGGNAGKDGGGDNVGSGGGSGGGSPGNGSGGKGGHR
ncbi:MAG: hypothetical protein JRG97_15135 [Deltaproteobacteria bacterium]|nr:hypothetical protein [Deltaproteobacteria bacterium]MBW2142371.1 hypothetical protein [Deltaproteobacteria bacterium]